MVLAGHEEGGSKKLLGGMRVLSFCHYLQGPAAVQYLADLGADVIKVEPRQGAFERRWAGAGTFIEDVSVFFLAANRNQRSLAIDLKHPGSREVLDRLIGNADVIVENYRPGTMDRLALGYEDARRIKPDIIYASATGYGSEGPLRDRPGQDLLVQARSGLIRASGARPTATGCAVVDQHGAALLALGIAAAYGARLTTGQGTRIEGNLLNAAIDLQAEALTLYYSGGRSSESLERDPHLGSWYHEAPYGIYAIADADVVISLTSVAKLADALDSAPLKALSGRDAYLDRDLIAATVAEALSAWRFEALKEKLDLAGIWHERVSDYDDLLADPQVVQNEMFRTLPVRGAEATLVNHPLRYDGKLPPLRRAPPELGEHNEEILTELAFSRSEIDTLIASGSVAKVRDR